MRRAALVLIACAAAVGGCGSAPPAAPTAPPSPAFDTITIDVTAGGGSPIVMYDVENGSQQMQSKTAQAVNRAPFHHELSKPHGPRDIWVNAYAFGSGNLMSCTVRINGVVVAADTEKEVGGGATCLYKGIPV